MEKQLYYRVEFSEEQFFIYHYEVKKVTPKGVWIELYHGELKFINANWQKKYAYPTMEKAVISFVKRKERQIQILNAQLIHAKTTLEQFNQIKDGGIEIGSWGWSTFKETPKPLKVAFPFALLPE